MGERGDGQDHEQCQHRGGGWFPHKAGPSGLCGVLIVGNKFLVGMSLLYPIFLRNSFLSSMSLGPSIPRGV